jgi:hypothetical protein
MSMADTEDGSPLSKYDIGFIMPSILFVRAHVLLHGVRRGGGRWENQPPPQMATDYRSGRQRLKPAKSPDLVEPTHRRGAPSRIN